MIIYITTNLINGKKYIGQDRKNNPDYLGSGKIFIKSLKLYGKCNFKKDILAHANCQKDLDNLEKYYIKLYDAQKSKFFYNISPGGTGGKIAINYEYREVPVFEICVKTNNIIGKYKSSKEAALINNLNYKVLNGVCNGDKAFVKNRLFIYQSDFNVDKIKLRLQMYRAKYIILSLKTGIFYFNKKDLYKFEYSHYKSFSSFINILHKKKENFFNKILMERI